MNSSQSLKAQYERFPYPPIPFLALPRPGEGEALKYENAGRFLSRPFPSQGIRILVIGGGTLEPLVASMAHPFAHEIVNVDLSSRSIDILNRRSQFFSWARPFSKRALIRNFNGDFTQLDQGLFDYVIASNSLHHSEDPARSLARAAEFLKPGGVFRLVTYPKESRHWLRKASEYLKSEGADKSSNPKRDALIAVRKLSISNPIRTAFESHPERGTNTGVIDAFFNACENPLSPLEWQVASENAGLTLIGEAQDENSRSSLVDQVAPTLSVWEKLQVMDDTWELCANPILWFLKGGPHLLVENRVMDQKQPRLRADQLLKKGGSNLTEWQNWLAKEVGPRTWPGHPDEIMRGHSITEYPLNELLSGE